MMQGVMVCHVQTGLLLEESLNHDPKTKDENQSLSHTVRLTYSRSKSQEPVATCDIQSGLRSVDELRAPPTQDPGSTYECIKVG